MTTETETLPIFKLAGQMFDAFERRQRDNGDSFVCLKEGSPEWMVEVLHAAHGDMLPDDFKYETAREALGYIFEQGEDFDADGHVHEFADDVDVYNAGLLAWCASNLHRMAYVDEALEEYGATTLAQALMQGQASERREIFEAVVAALVEVSA